MTTRHTEIGYSNNIQIVADALREHFGLDDGSHVLTAVAAHVWGEICHRSCDDKGGKEWGREEVMRAIFGVQYRINEMARKMGAV